MIQTDTFLKIGKTHQVCEDYIISGNKPFNYIILSDGCSSSKNTDMGARILCHLAKQYLLYRKDDYRFPVLDYDEMGLWIIHGAELTARQLGLNRSCLNATLIIAYEFEKQYHVYMYGDGVIILQKFNKRISITEIEFTKNAPYYLSYKVDPESMDLFHKLKQDVIIKNIVHDSEIIGKYAYDYKNTFTIDCNVFPRMLICSDGMSSFLKDGSQTQSIYDITKEFLAYKSTKGEFLKRRLKRAIKIYKENGIEHMDDLSVGAFLCEE